MLLLGSFSLLGLHASAAKETQDFLLPASRRLHSLERRKSILHSQVEAASVHAALSGGSTEERVRLYVLPDTLPLDRIVLTIELFMDYVQKKGDSENLSPLIVGEKTHHEGYTTTPLTLSFTSTELGVTDVLSFFTFTGFSTIADALTEEERNKLLHAAEMENPASVLALESFFETNLLRFAQSPDTIDEFLRRSFVSPSFHEVYRSILHSSLLFESRQLFEGEVGTLLLTRNLFPLPFMSVTAFDMMTSENGMYTVSMEILAYARS